MKRSGIRSALAACALAAATLPDPALAAQRSFAIGFTSNGAGSATGTLVIDDAVCANPGSSNIVSGCVVDLWIQITGAASGNGLFTEANLMDYFFSPSMMLNYDAELIAQGMSDVNFFFNAPGPMGVMPFVLATDGGVGDQFTIVSLTPGGDPEPEPEPELEFPFAVDSQKCADAIGKAGAGYWTARHKSLAACRSAFMAGTPVYSDKSKTTLVESPSGCAGEVKAAASIARAREKVRAGVAKRCTDALLANLLACGGTVDAIADATGATGCLIEAIDASVDDALDDEFGF